jgi:hypothetical protein
MYKQIANGFIQAVEFTESEGSVQLMSLKSKILANKICREFYKKHKDVIEAYKIAMEKSGKYFESGEYSNIGHDFWLTSQGHGAGFWDRGIDTELEKQLTEISKTYSFNAYVSSKKIMIDCWGM